MYYFCNIFHHQFFLQSDEIMAIVHIGGRGGYLILISINRGNNIMKQDKNIKKEYTFYICL